MGDLAGALKMGGVGLHELVGRDVLHVSCSLHSLSLALLQRRSCYCMRYE